MCYDLNRYQKFESGNYGEREQVDDNLKSYSRDEFRYKNRLQRYLIASLVDEETR
jgi:hypothetical protein